MAKRYPAGINPDDLPVHSADGMLIFTAVIGVLVGIALVTMGLKGKQLWMWVWGLALIVFSLYMGGVLLE